MFTSCIIDTDERPMPSPIIYIMFFTGSWARSVPTLRSKATIKVDIRRIEVMVLVRQI